MEQDMNRDVWPSFNQGIIAPRGQTPSIFPPFLPYGFFPRRTVRILPDLDIEITIDSGAF